MSFLRPHGLRPHGLRPWTLAAGALALAFTLSTPAEAQAEPRLFVVTYIDVFPDFAADTGKALRDFSTASSKDAGFVRMEVMRDVARTNHFTMVEVWRSRKDYEAHLTQAHSKQFREKIQPGMGSPFDERMYNLLQ